MAGTPIATGLAGIHAVTFSSGGDLGANMYAASWSTGQLLQIDPDGVVTELASGLSLTNYDGNILAVSSDGNVMFVADRMANQLVCIEAI
jgi:sugar lactone lactonase YvrE